ncbi:MAG: Gfo/Idh/MocA family oxidoreductase [Rhodopirellula sp.]|nr:Gfo/Idh/MocA family oxidoreductase [Rhodopirellula sp.]
MNGISRRRFLEDSMLAIAAAGAGSAGVLHLTAPQAAARVGANEKIGVCVVGVGGRGWGSHCAEWVKDPRTEIRYLCDPDSTKEKKCDEIAKRQGGVRPKFVTDMRKAFEDSAVDVVSNASSNHWHALCGVWAMQAKKHCYLEKPISHNVHEGRALVAAAKKYAMCCQVGTQCRSNPSNIESVRFIQEGGIGEVKFARGLCYRRRKSIGPLGQYEVPKEVDYNLWSGPAPTAPLTRPQFHYDWHWQRMYGNGDLGNQGPHQTDIARWHLGIDRFPKSVVTWGGRLGYDVEMKDPNFVDAGDTGNIETTIYDYGDKCIVFETYGLDTPDVLGAKVGVISYGSKGYLVQSTYDYAAAFDPDGNKIREFKGSGNHFGNFLDAVQANDPSMLNSDALCGHLSAGLSHIGNISYYLGENHKVSVDELKAMVQQIKSLDDNVATLERIVEKTEKYGVDLKRTPFSIGPLLRFDPKSETFLDNAEANAMISREYRAPFVVPKPEDV